MALYTPRLALKCTIKSEKELKRQQRASIAPSTFLIQSVVVVIPRPDPTLATGRGGDVDGGAALLLNPPAVHLHPLGEDELSPIVAIPVGQGVDTVIVVVILQLVQDRCAKKEN